MKPWSYTDEESGVIMSYSSSSGTLNLASSDGTITLNTVTVAQATVCTKCIKKLAFVSPAHTIKAWTFQFKDDLFESVELSSSKATFLK